MADDNKFDFQPEEPFKAHKGEEDSVLKDVHEGTKAAARGGLQGLSYGTSDEIIGGLKGLRDAMGEKKLSFDDIKKFYIKHRDEEREENKKAEEAHPYLYKGAELAAGLAAPGGALLHGAKEASTAAKLGRMALGGAGLGAAAGAGYSNAAPNTGEFAKDVGLGAAAGVLPGVALGGAYGAAKLGKEILPGIPFVGPAIGKIAEGAVKGAEGESPSQVKLTENVEDLLKSVGEKYSSIKSTYEGILEKAASEGRKVDLSDFKALKNQLVTELQHTRSPKIKEDITKILSEVEPYIPPEPKVVVPPRARPLEEGLIDNQGRAVAPPKVDGEATQFLTPPPPKPMISPKDAQDLKSTLGNMASFHDSDLATSSGKGLAGNLKQGLGDRLLEEVPGLKSNDADYSKLTKTLEQLGMKPENLYTKNQLTGELEINPQAITTVQNLLKRAAKENTGGDVAKKKLALFRQGLQSVGIPEKMFELSKKASASNVYDTARGKVGGYVGNAAMTAGEKLAEPTAKTLATAPDVANFYKQEANNPYQLSKDVKDASKDDLLDFAETAKEIPGLQDQGTRLQDSVDRGDLQSTNTVLHDLLQRPSFRKTLYKRNEQKP